MEVLHQHLYNAHFRVTQWYMLCMSSVCCASVAFAFTNVMEIRQDIDWQISEESFKSDVSGEVLLAYTFQGNGPLIAN